MEYEVDQDAEQMQGNLAADKIQKDDDQDMEDDQNEDRGMDQ